MNFVDRIEARCFGLGEWPHSGQLRPDLGTGIRTVPFESVLIAYEIAADKVQILRVFRQRQDYTRLLKR